MREPGREPRYRRAATPSAQGQDPILHEAPSPVRSPKNQADRIRGIRARLQEGDYEAPPMLVAECMIAQALAGFGGGSRAQGSVAPPPDTNTPGEAA